MSVLVTGGAGYIGSHTCLELINSGYKVIVADNLINSSAESLKRVKAITGQDIDFYRIDVCSQESLEEIFEKHSDIDSVIHFAGLKAVGESVTMPLAYYSNNINSTLSLCKVMERRGVKRLIFSSSATVYSGSNEMPLVETSKTGDCTNPYGWTKYMCEQILQDCANASADWSVALLRYFNPVGAHSSGSIGEDPSGTPNNLVPYITQTAIGRLKELSVYGGDYSTPDGTGVRDYIHVSDLARGHVSAIKYCEKNKGVDTFNLGTGRGVSVLEMVRAFEQVNEVKVAHKIVERRPGDLAVCYADASKARRLLGWSAEKNLEDMCADAWRWQSKNPMGYR